MPNKAELARELAVQYAQIELNRIQYKAVKSDHPTQPIDVSCTVDKLTKQEESLQQSLTNNNISSSEFFNIITPIIFPNGMPENRADILHGFCNFLTATQHESSSPKPGM